ncbi:hypothetical protein B0T10DRAFT_495055 [Thelonectria olida]|uniref:Zn(2)-C6 fungal-type domain-containing protein n=1 Tax=Thelonectria olida TaxID=1576542 RepID=A0A9P9ANB3_9HYPO|nr:hypothetical protein B0T10DRAFT_495055 [Thelonectria olida]
MMRASRGTLSCASCRQRKLKCDRNEPCGNCVARKVDCQYANRQDGHHLNARLRRLEQLIGTLTAERGTRQDMPIAQDAHLRLNEAHGTIGEPSTPNHVGRDVAACTEEASSMPGRMMGNDNQITYVSAVHWAAIHNEVTKVREYLEQENASEEDQIAEQNPRKSPMLLGRPSKITSVKDVLSDIPPKSVSDRLVSRYFTSNEPSIILLHGPTFQKEYKDFWVDPDRASAQWVSLLFGVLFMGTFLYVRSQDGLPQPLGNPAETMDVFLRRSTECLGLSEYTAAPGSHTVEALLFNIQAEFVRNPDAQPGVWVLSGVATRVAMRMGLHRDPDHYRQISPFQGEMRRRVWACISQLDALTSYQLGLPSMIQQVHCDTRPPLNLHDEDLHPDAVQLPQPRGVSEITPILYTITKGKFMALFTAILNQASAARSNMYEDVIALDKQLDAVYQSVPPRLRSKSLEDSITASPYLVMRRYNLELFYQKSRCILHRYHMARSYQDPQYLQSRRTCVEAAMALLAHQTSIWKEVQAGGLLQRDSWFISSLEHHDFILASMIVCLELSSTSQNAPANSASAHETSGLKYGREELIAAVEKSREFWEQFKTRSRDARQAAGILNLMLNKVATNQEPKDGNATIQNAGQNTQSSEGWLKPDQAPTTNSESLESDPSQALNPDLGFSLSTMTQTSQPEGDAAFEEIGFMLDAPDLIDWDLWETHIQNSRATMEF